MSSDIVSYLNPGDFYSKLRLQLEAAKMSKMPPAQWVAFVKGLNGKGVTQVEIDDSKLIPWLEQSSEKSLTKEDVIVRLDRTAVTVKEVVLGLPKYMFHSHASTSDTYLEILYIANSETSNYSDRIEEIEFEMEELAFDPDLLVKRPGLVSKLVSERASLMQAKPMTIDFDSHHFSDRVRGKHGKNLLFHIRVVISTKPNGKKLFFIDEIQSDWGQKGRLRQRDKKGYRDRGLPVPNWHPHVPKGPWVTDTKLWAGLAVRRILQRAALIPDVDEVAWIRLSMRNGGLTDPRQEDERLAAQVASQAAENDLDSDADEVETDHYYRKLIPSIVDRLISKSGSKVSYANVVRLKDKSFGNLPGFQMTDDVRALLKGPQPLYSAASVLRSPPVVPNERLDELLQRGSKMLGTAAKIQFVAKILDFQDMSYKSGSFMNRIMAIALNSKDLDAALNHESYHCAHELFLTQRERNAMLVAFRPDGELNQIVRERLISKGEIRAAKQCRSAEEAAAHAFALWSSGDLAFKASLPAEQVGIFQSIKACICDVVRWLAGESIEKGINTPEKVFSALRDGVLFARYEEQISKESTSKVVAPAAGDWQRLDKLHGDSQSAKNPKEVGDFLHKSH
jgi:hypothetical protein